MSQVFGRMANSCLEEVIMLVFSVLFSSVSRSECHLPRKKLKKQTTTNRTHLVNSFPVSVLRTLSASQISISSVQLLIFFLIIGWKKLTDSVIQKKRSIPSTISVASNGFSFLQNVFRFLFITFSRTSMKQSSYEQYKNHIHFRVNSVFIHMYIYIYRYTRLFLLLCVLECLGRNLIIVHCFYGLSA